CSKPPLGPKCVVCQRQGKWADFKQIGPSYHEWPNENAKFIHPACLSEVEKERDLPTYACPLCKHTHPAVWVPATGINWQCRQCGNPNGGERQDKGMKPVVCEYCGVEVVRAYARRAQYGRHCHRTCFRSRHPIQAWLYGLFG